jgi:hypothetical protein
LNAGTGAQAVYNSFGNDPHTILEFIYTAAAGQSTPHLDYLDPATSLQLPTGASITWASDSKVPANLALPAHGSPGSLGATSSIAIQTDTTAVPFVANVSSPAVNGTYGIGATIPIVVSLGIPAAVTGTPQLQLALVGGQTALATYVSGSGTNTLVFKYTVAAGQSTGTAFLDDGASLLLSGKSLSLPAPGAQGSLGINSRIVIDTAMAAAPVVQSVTAGVPNGVFQAGNIIPIAVHFSRAVTVTGTPTLALAVGSSPVLVNYSGGSGTDTLTFDYTIAAGQNSAKLDYASADALQTLPGNSITDSLNQQGANPKLPMPGLVGSLSDNALIVVSSTGGSHPGPNLISTKAALMGPPSVFDGERFTLTAVVTSESSGDSIEAGQVTFMAGSTVLGTVTLTGGNASLQLQLPAGNYTVIAVYQGDATHSGSTSKPLAIKVEQLIVNRSKLVVENPDGTPAFAVQPYGPRNRAGYNVAEGQVKVDGAADIFVAPKPGHRGPVEIIDGTNGAVVRTFYAFGRKYSGGVALAAADLNGAGISDIITGQATGRRSRIKFFNSANGQRLRSITAFHHVFHRGLSLSTRDVNNLGQPDIVATSQGRHHTLVEIFDGRTGLSIGGIERLPSGPAASFARKAPRR